MICSLILGLLVTASASRSSRADVGIVRVVFAKAGLIIGVGRGRGILTLRGHDYRFKVSGLSFGATVGASASRLSGRALNIVASHEFAGHYKAVGAAGALVAGAGSVQLQNEKGVILQLQGGEVGLEVSIAASGVQITME
jgi:hypothetical protein